MPRKTRLKQQRAILAHRAHLPLLHGMAQGLAKLLPDDMHFIVITFCPVSGAAGGYVSNGHNASTRRALQITTKGFQP